MVMHAANVIAIKVGEELLEQTALLPTAYIRGNSDAKAQEPEYSKYRTKSHSLTSMATKPNLLFVKATCSILL